ncbi:MAG: hypothetical protein Q7K55_05430 [Candidatus Levybacteria bacterium]|nr:hypothetical protein [Candidatus Levybacteria bacterium]
MSNKNNLKVKIDMQKIKGIWIVLIAIIAIGLFNTDLSTILGISTKKDSNVIPFPLPTITVPTAEPTPTPTSTPIPTIAPRLQQNTYIAPTVDPDPVIDCKAPQGSSCYGQSLSIKRSVCGTNFASCCQIGSLWKMMTKTECNAAQATNVHVTVPAGNSSNRVPVFISYYGWTISCPSQNVVAVQSINSTMESKRSQWSTYLDNCNHLFFTTDSCYIACGTIPYGENYSSLYSDCISKCPSALDHCEYTSSERKNLSAQIDSLCK